MHCVIVSFCFLFFMPPAGVIDAGQSDPRSVDIPDAASRDAARVEVRGVFEEEYAAHEKHASGKGGGTPGCVSRTGCSRRRPV